MNAPVDASLVATGNPSRIKPVAWFYLFIGRILQVGSTWKVAAASFVWLFATTGVYPLLLPDEGRYVGVAWNMLSAGQLSTPLLDGLPFFHKPPLFYWVSALSLHLLGSSEWAARMSSVLAATLTITLLFWFLKNYANQRLAASAAIILASQPFLFGAAHYANLDMMVAAMITATIITAAAAVLEYERQAASRVILTTAYAFAGLGFLSKGLIGVVLPGGVIFFWLLGRRRFDSMRHLIYLPGLAVLAAITLPWMLVMQQRYPGFFDYYIVYQHFERFLEKGFNNPHPFWFYGPVLLGLTLPWSLQLRQLVGLVRRGETERSPLSSLMLSWLLLILVFFSLPESKLVGYILPALPPLAYFLAGPFVRRLQGAARSSALKAFSCYLAVSIAICVAVVLAMVLAPQPSTEELALMLRDRYQPEDQIVMLERYRYDLNFYAGIAKPALVVSNWDDPELKHQDNWRKELYDAGLFDPESAAKLLINPEQLLSLICKKHAGSLWLLGDKNTVQRYAFLQTLDNPMQSAKLRAWRIDAQTRPTFCH